MLDVVNEQRASTVIQLEIDDLRARLADLAVQEQEIDNQQLADSVLDEGYQETLAANRLKIQERREALDKTLVVREAEHRSAFLAEQVAELSQQVKSLQIQRANLAYEQAELDAQLEGSPGHESGNFADLVNRRREIMGQIAALEIALTRREADYKAAQVSAFNEQIHQAYQELVGEMLPQQVKLNQRIGEVYQNLDVKRGQFQSYWEIVRVRVSDMGSVFDRPMRATAIQKRLDDTDVVWAKYEQVAAEYQNAQTASVKFERERYETAQWGALLVGQIQEAIVELQQLGAPIPSIVDQREFRCFSQVNKSRG